MHTMASLIRRLFAWAPACWLLVCLFAPHWAAQAETGPLERQVKAAYLVRFGGFVEWPEGTFAGADTPLQIGISGNDALAEQVDLMAAGRNTSGRPIVVRGIRRGDPLTGLHILYVAPGDRAAMSELLQQARGQALLTVSDSHEGAALGSMVNFVIAGDRLRFEVAMQHVTAGHLRISARMLAVAHKVLGAT
jgi:hypothetical protein